MKDLQKLMDDIREWSDATFGEGQRNPAIAYHLQKEVPELIEAIEKFQKEDSMGHIHRAGFEFADCFMLLLDSASHFGLTAGNLLWYTEEKLKVNKERKWGKPDENGVVEHIPEEPGERIENTCIICGKTFYGNVKFEICPTCYI
jgi:NTP pyrophosphatase (non-canonical NTP hydrolase)